MRVLSDFIRDLLFRKGTGWAGTIRGDYDIFGDVIAGSIEADLRVCRVGLQIQVVRRGVVVIVHDVPETTGGYDLIPFEFAIGGHFTVAELVKEDVQLVLRNLRGDTGSLKLDGATSIGLIRDYLGVPCEAVIDLAMSKRGLPEQHLGRGWTAPGVEYTWTEDDESEIIFSHANPRGKYVFRMIYSVMLGAQVSNQYIEIFLDGSLITAFSENAPKFHFKEVFFDASAFSGAATSRLLLRHPLAARPSEHHLVGGDSRRLAFGIRRLTIARLLD